MDRACLSASPLAPERRRARGAQGTFICAPCRSLSGGCVVATFPPGDAGIADVPLQCAALAADGPLAGRTASIVGRYAVHIDSFGTAAQLPPLLRQNRHFEELYVGDLAVVGDALKLTLQPCALTWTSDGHGSDWTTAAVVTAPDTLPARELTVQLSTNCGFSASATRDAEWGYDSQAGCSAQSDSVAKPWQMAPCTCGTDDPPSSADDCRVDDPDGNGEPGLAEVEHNHVASDKAHRLTARVRSGLLHGLWVADGKHTAEEQRDVSVAHLSLPDYPPATPCAVETSTVRFQRLSVEGSARAACDSARGTVRGLAELSFPALGCGGQ